MRKIERISIGAADRERLERLVRDRNTPQKVVWRARIVLLAGDGLTAEGIAAAVDKSLLRVRRWRRRYAAKGVDGLLKDATRPSRVKPLSPEKVAQVVHMTLHEKPRMRPTGAHAAWQRRPLSPTAACSASGMRMDSSHIWSRPSKSLATRTLPPKSRTWSGSISTRRTRPWSCASMRRAKSRRWIAPNAACP